MSKPLAQGRFAVLSAVVLGCLLSATPASARSRTWMALAPAPLASDSAYAAFSAGPRESLNVSQLAWLEVQKDWRSQRNAEQVGGGVASITGGGLPHRPRPDDARFAALASKPYGALDESERTWLVLESTAQRASQDRAKGTSDALALALVAGLIGVIGGAALAIHAIFGAH